MAGEEYDTEPVEVGEQPGAAWRRLTKRGAIATMVVVAILTVLSGQPPLVLLLALLGVGLLWRGQRPDGRGWVIFLGAVSLVLFLLNLPFAILALAHPASTFEFILVGLLLLPLLVTGVGMIGALRATSAGTQAARWVGRSAIGAAVLIIVIGIAAGVTAKDEQARPGDIALAADKLKWNPTTLQAKAGPIAIVVDNKDQVRHDFTIKNVVADDDLTAGKVRRVEFTAAAGTYEFVCRLRPNMKGTLIVS